MKPMNEILNQMLTGVTNSVDVSEGSFTYDSLVGTALGLEDAYLYMDEILELAFAQTSYGQWLDKKVAEQGLTRKPSVKATTTVKVMGNEGVVIPKDTLFITDDIYYVSTESKTIDVTGIVYVPIECITGGIVGNVPSNTITKTDISLVGINSITNENPVTNGVDEEDDETLRNRYFDKVKAPTTSGNKHHYRIWANEVVGVGNSKVVPLWNGNGTIKVIVCNSEYKAPISQVVTDVANYIETQRPIGATVTVVGATEKSIDISLTVTYDTRYSTSQIQTNIRDSIVDYFRSIALEKTVVSYAMLSGSIVNADGVLDSSNLTVNTGVANITLLENEVPVLGTLTINFI